MFVSYLKYTTFESLSDDFIAVLEPLGSFYPELHGNRLGIRYINNIELPAHDPMDWSAYIDAGLLGLFDRFNEDRAAIARLFHIAEFKYDDMLVKFQFGIPNPDFPAPVRQSAFILDIDAFVPGLIEFSDVEGIISMAHSHIQGLFESSITDALREKMHERI